MVVKSIFALVLTFYIALILISSLSLAIQYGNLRVRVVECSCNNPISDARVCVQSIETDPCKNTDSNGEVLFENLVVGTYSIQVSKDGYNPNSTVESVKCGRTVEVVICLNKIKVCNPGEIVNRRCACSTQVAYERCKTDGSGWETVIENCRSGYVCSNGYCVESKDGWYDTWETRCNLEGRSCGYGTKEMKQEYRDYTCIGVTCSYVVTQARWVPIDSCYVPCSTTKVTTIPTQEKDGWYDTSQTRCNLHGNPCGYGTKEMKQEYRDYTCIGVTCSYVVTQTRWVAIGECNVPCQTTTTTTPVQEKDGWYDTGNEKCDIDNFECGEGVRMKEQEYRDYTCIGVTCSYVVTARRWVIVGSCSKSCPSGKTCVNGYCKSIFDCNSLDGWYNTQEEKCSIELECGSGIKLIKEEYRDYYPIASPPLDSSGCAFEIKDVRWRSIGSCYVSCPNGYYCEGGICRQVKLASRCEVRIFVKDKETNLPIENAKVCYDGVCYLTGSNGVALFYVDVGTYNLHVSKIGYVSKSLIINCLDCGNPIFQTVTLEKVKTCFDCNSLDGWYYTTESYCDTAGLECGRGIRLRKEEFRDYSGSCVDSSLQCKDYKVVAYRWVEDGYCYKNCSIGYCEEGLCKREEKTIETIELKQGYQEYEHPKAKEFEIDWLVLLMFLLLLILFTSLILERKKKSKDC